LHDDLLYSENSKANKKAFSHHEKEITGGIKALNKEKKKCKNRDKRREIYLQVAALTQEKTVLHALRTEQFLAQPDSLLSL
jgi:hypothetical protein